MAKQSFDILVPAGWKTSGDPLLKALGDNGGELYSALEAVKGQVRQGKRGPTGVWLHSTRVTDAGLEALAGLASITEFQSSERMTDAALVHLRNMIAMERLVFHKMRLTGDGLKHLARMSRLKSFQLPSCTITDTALSHLPPLPAVTLFSLSNCTGFTDTALEYVARLGNVENLGLHGTPGAGPGLRHLAALHSLQQLSLSGFQEGKITDDGLTHLPGLPRLESLSLRDTRVTDDGLRHLARLPGLQYLDLEMTAVGDDGMRHLAALPHLQSVNLNHTRVTIRGVRELQTARPGISVSAHSCAVPSLTEPAGEEKVELIRRPDHRLAVPVAQSWIRIEKWLAQHLPAALGTLRPPTRESDLAELEKQIGCPLPTDFRESYLIHDGQDWEEETGGMGVILGLHLAPIADGEGVLWLYEHRVQHQWPEKDNWMLDWTFYPPDAIREAWSGPGWVPFYWDVGRNFLGIDLDPGPNGVVGQVIPFGSDDEFRPVLALSFAHFLEDIADELEAGHAAVEPPEVTSSPFRLKGVPHGYFRNCYKQWAEAKLPQAFQQAKLIPRIVPEDHTTPITGELAVQLVVILRSFLTAMNEYERRWLSVRPIREYGVENITECGPGQGLSWSAGRLPGEQPKNRVQQILWDPEATHDEQAEALGVGKYWKEAVAEKRVIWRRLLTSGKRSTDRTFHQQDPPYYDPRTVIDPVVRRVASDHALIEFGQVRPAGACGVGRLRYHLRLERGRWRIERHEAVDDPKKPWKLDFP